MARLTPITPLPIIATSTASSPLAQLLLRADAAGDGEQLSDTIPSGFPSLDEPLAGGFRRGDLIVLGGDVGAGKSALALSMALRAADSGRSSAFFSGEMTVDRLMERVLAIEGRVGIDEMRRGSLNDTARAGVGAAALRLRDRLPVLARIPAGGAAVLAETLHRTLDLEIAVVDSLQSLPTGTSQEEELAAAVRRLKTAAVDCNIALVVTAHLPALRADRQDQRPTLEDFGALGAVKQHADIVLGLFREEMYDPGHQAAGATELSVLKNRNGSATYIDLYFYKQWLRFEDMVEPSR